MLIVLEGCDGTGKSTVANNLKQVIHDAEIVHCTRFTPNDFRFFLDLIEASKTKNIIADRFCYGQFVYQTLEERPLDEDELIDLEVQMIAAGAKVIHVCASVDEIKDRLNLRGEETSLPVEDICNGFLDLFERTLIKPFVWWTGSDC